MSEFVIITGLSGAGRSTAGATFEDLGWFVIDNLPPALIPRVADLAEKSGAETERIALVVWTSPFFEDLLPAIDQLADSHAAGRVRILFLEARDDVLVRRYEGSRRKHPVEGEGGGVSDAIARERHVLEPVKARADVVVDTSDLNVHQLRDRLVELFASNEPSAMQTSVVSFGYMHGIPLDVDLVLDCRFLPNPHWVDELRPHPGTDPRVRKYVMDQPETKQFLDKLDDLLGLLLPSYVKEGKSYLTIAVGCTGGKHRSVVLAEELGRILSEHGFDPTVHHRDITRT